MKLTGLSLNSDKINDLIIKSKQMEEKYYYWLIKDYGFDGPEQYTPQDLRLLLQRFFSHKVTDTGFTKKIKRASSVEHIIDVVIDEVGNVIKPQGLKDLSTQIIQNISNEQYKQETGNITELLDMVKLGKHLKNMGITNVSIIDTTSSLGNGEDVKFDFVLGLDLTGNNKEDISLLVNKIPFEVKSGITADPASSKFEFGQFSSGAFYKRKAVYRDLKDSIEWAIINTLQDDSYYTDERVIRIETEELMRIFVIEYIIWRLENNIPFFIGSNGALLCSDVLEYMNSHKKTFVTYDLQDFRVYDYWLIDPETDNMEIDQDKICQEIIKQFNKFNVKIGYGKLHS